MSIQFEWHSYGEKIIFIKTPQKVWVIASWENVQSFAAIAINIIEIFSTRFGTKIFEPTDTTPQTPKHSSLLNCFVWHGFQLGLSLLDYKVFNSEVSSRKLLFWVSKCWELKYWNFVVSRFFVLIRKLWLWLYSPIESIQWQFLGHKIQKTSQLILLLIQWPFFNLQLDMRGLTYFRIHLWLSTFFFNFV